MTYDPLDPPDSLSIRNRSLHVGTQEISTVEGLQAALEAAGSFPLTWDSISGDLSDATDLQNALDLKAALGSPALTGTPTAPTAAFGTDTTQIATTAFVQDAVDAVGGGSPAWGAVTGTLASQTDLQNALNLKATLASPALTGTPTAPTASVSTDTTQIANTAFVQDVKETVCVLTGRENRIESSSLGSYETFVWIETNGIAIYPYKQYAEINNAGYYTGVNIAMSNKYYSILGNSRQATLHQAAIVSCPDISSSAFAGEHTPVNPTFSSYNSKLPTGGGTPWSRGIGTHQHSISGDGMQWWGTNLDDDLVANWELKLGRVSNDIVGYWKDGGGVARETIRLGNFTGLKRPVKHPQYTMATGTQQIGTTAGLPSATDFVDCFIRIMDETGGPCLAYAHAGLWKRVKDDATCVITTAPGRYLRPGGAFGYKRPGGVDSYRRP